MTLEDDDFLRIVRSERYNSIGMADAPHGGDEIVDEREKAYEYYKGEMRDMPPPLENRSKVVTSEVRDAILTTVPDIVEMFISGDEIGTFEAVGPEDEELAKQETLIVNHVIFGENDAFIMVHDVCHDALLAKFGVVHFYPEVNESQEEERFEGMLAMDLQVAEQSGEIADVEQIDEDLYNFTLRRKKRDVRICIDPVAPEDFSVGRDTIKLKDATYCVMRTRVRAQQLLADGFDPELVDQIPDDTHRFATDEIDQARDLAGEHEAEGLGGAAIREMREVVIHVHNVRLDADGKGLAVWRVTTDENEAILLERRKVSCIEFAGGTPIRQPHRLYGFSQADLLIEVQKIKTSLTRMLLDMGYFAINTRHTINMQRASNETIMDYLRNEPGVPVRVDGDNCIVPLSPGQPGFDPFAALEYFATLGELRAGVMRASMGIDPDSLHETKGAALAMLNAAQRRIRFIARTLAETCFRDLFVGVHTLLREHGAEMRKRIKGNWVQADPSSWGSRRDMTVDIGSGSAGREYDLAISTNIRGMVGEIIQGQASGAVAPPIVTAQNVYNLARRTIERAGWKNADLYVTDPSKQPPEQQQKGPSPEEQKVQAEIQKMQMDAKLDQQKAAIKAQQDQRKAESDAQIALIRIRAEAQAKREQMEIDAQLKREHMLGEYELERERMEREAENATYQATLQAQVAEKKVEAMSQNRPGGRLDR